MISQAIQTKLVALIPRSYFSIGDEDIQAPYCVHRENCVGYSEHKAGSKEYTYEVEIAIIEDKPGELETLANSVRAAITALEGQTTNSTYIQDVTYMGDSPEYDDEEKLYVTVLRYSITTTNR